MKMDTIPKVKTMLAFLRANGFEQEDENKVFYIMRPPSFMKFEGDFHYFIPRHEKFSDYKRVAENLVESFSQLFEMDIDDLRELLSQDLKTIKENAEIGAKMAAFAN